MTNQLMDARAEGEKLRKAVRDFAKAIGCESTKDGGKKFVRIMLPIVAGVAFEDGDVLDRIGGLIMDSPHRKARA